MGPSPTVAAPQTVSTKQGRLPGPLGDPSAAAVAGMGCAVEESPTPQPTSAFAPLDAGRVAVPAAGKFQEGIPPPGSTAPNVPGMEGNWGGGAGKSSIFGSHCGRKRAKVGHGRFGDQKEKTVVLGASLGGQLGDAEPAPPVPRERHSWPVNCFPGVCLGEGLGSHTWKAEGGPRGVCTP